MIDWRPMVKDACAPQCFAGKKLMGSLLLEMWDGNADDDIDQRAVLQGLSAWLILGGALTISAPIIHLTQEKSEHAN